MLKPANHRLARVTAADGPDCFARMKERARQFAQVEQSTVAAVQMSNRIARAAAGTQSYGDVTMGFAANPSSQPLVIASHGVDRLGKIIA